MDRKILRLALVIAVSLFVGTVFTGCNDGEDASAEIKTDFRINLKVKIHSDDARNCSDDFHLEGNY